MTNTLGNGFSRTWSVGCKLILKPLSLVLFFKYPVFMMGESKEFIGAVGLSVPSIIAVRLLGVLFPAIPD